MIAQTTDRREIADENLIKQIAEGNKLAMRALFARHQVRVYRFALRIVRDSALAEDVVSETFIDAWQHAGRYEGRSTASTWLLGIARHKVFSARPRFEHVTVEDDMLEANGDSEDPGAALQARDRASVLRHCITRLSDEHREIIDLVYYHEQSVDAVATILGIPHNTAKTRVFYARRRLGDELKKSGLDWTVM